MARFPTPEEDAAVQAAIGDAYDAWVREVEDEIDYAPPDGAGPTEVPAFSELVQASPAQLGDLSARVQRAESMARHTERSA